MALQGNLHDFAVSEILQLLGTQKKTGCLRLEWSGERAHVYVHDGRVVSTREAGMGLDDPLLRFLTDAHRLSDEQRRGLQSIHKESNRDLEELLVNGRYMEAEELKVFIERQILDDIMRLMRWENGSYRFDPRQTWTVTPLVRLGMEGVLIEASRRLDEQKRFMAEFKDPHALLGVCDLPDPDEPLADEEKELFGIIDGQHTVAEVVEAAPLCEYEAYEALHRMLEARWIEIAGRRDPGRGVGMQPERRPDRTARRRASIGGQLLVATGALLAVAGLQFAARLIRPQAARAPADDVFAATQLGHIRYALDLYRRERGSYPERLRTLVEDDWVDPAMVNLPGYRIQYRMVQEGNDYRLELKPALP
jgi:uncharacterized protein DUF4388